MRSPRRAFLRAVAGLGAAAAGCRTELGLGEESVETLWRTPFAKEGGAIGVADEYVCIPDHHIVVIPKTGAAPSVITPHRSYLSNGTDVAALGDTVYARTNSNDCWRSRLPNGPAEVILPRDRDYQAYTYDVVVDEYASYWSLMTHVHRIEHATGARATVATRDAYLCVRGEDLYVASPGALQRCDRRTLAVRSQLAVAEPSSITADDTRVYWFEHSSFSFWVADRDLKGAAQMRKSLSTNGRIPWGPPMVSDGNWLYHGVWDEARRRALFAMPCSGGEPFQIAPGFAPNVSSHRSLGLDAEYLYWLGGTPDPLEPGGVYRMRRLPPPTNSG